MEATLCDRLKAAKEALKGLPWFQATEPGVQHIVLNLGEEAVGVLEHLVSRPTVGGGVEVIRLENCLHPAGKLFGMIWNFQVKNIATDDIYRYQYFCWKQGPKSGSKGVVLIEEDGEITGLLCLRGFSFAVGDDTYDCIGGFADLSDGFVLELMGKRGLIREINEELGIENPAIKRIIELGKLLPDRGMTPNCPDIWAAVVAGETANSTIGHQNIDKWEMDASVFFVPVEKLWGPDGFLMENDDAFFLAVMARLMGLGIIRQPVAI